ncbi:thiamine pyrophosphate-binding protein [Tsukamurella soli]|uniref:acetolactate synthase n=1 Tax=Tsukamurella soli TaxID=644556 RepID=A0ABP8JC42_9ACTN
MVDRLYEYGIRSVFGVHGANSEDIFAAALRSEPRREGDLTVTVAKHEFGAGAMADGAARITGIPSVVLTTSGGGAMNAVAALAESYESRVPVLALIGCAARPGEGRGGFQDMLTPPGTVDALGVFQAVTGYAARITAPELLGPALDGALATLDRGLPAALLIPKDVQTAPAPDPSGAPALAGTRSVPVVPAAVVDLLRGAQRPLILLGEGASRAGLAKAVCDLVAATGAVVATTPNGRDACPPNAPFVGVTGVMGHPSSAAVAADADLILVLGSRLSATDRAGLDPHLGRATTVSVGADAPLRPVDSDVRTLDLAGWTAALAAELAGCAAPPWSDAQPTLLQPRQPDGVGTTCADATDALAAAIPPDALVFADAGNAGAAAIHRLPIGTGARFVVALGMGGMGYGIAGGIGAAIATGSHTVIIAGDGAFYMHGMEIHTAIEYDAPVTLVVLNNDAHGMCVTRENAFFPGVEGVNRFRHTDIGAGLRAMFPGLDVRSASDPAAVAATAADLLGSAPRGPSALVIDTDPLEIPPFAPLIQDHAPMAPPTQEQK